MDNKQERRTSAKEDPHAAPPPGNMAQPDTKAEAQKYKAHQKAITRGLRTFYDAVASEPVPDEFMAILRKMDESGQQ